MTAYRTVILDCDSTLSAIEGIEELAGAQRREIETLTDAAMRGEVPLEDVYGRRLDLIRPSRADVDRLLSRYVEALVDDAAAVVRALRAARIRVRLVSGGLLPPIAGLARHLGLEDDDAAAVPIRFADDGAYAGYDAASPLARAGGKADVILGWRAGPRPLPGPVMLVGDGATDLEAKDAVDLFVAYAGVVDRAAVTGPAPIVIHSRSLAPLLPLALGEASPEDVPGRAVWDRGRELIRNGAVTWR